MKMKSYRLFYMLMMYAIAPMVMADNYFDDDIYYDASKAKKNEKREIIITKTPEISKIEPKIVAVDYSSYGGSMRDVDEYNRQGVYSSVNADTIGHDSILNVDGYTYTNRIERFYNPEVVLGSGNQELIDSYSVNQPVVNIYVDSFWDPHPSWTWGYSYPWYSWNYTFYTGVWNPYWTNYGWYNPWYWDPYCYHYPYYGHHHHYGPAYYPHYSGVRPAPSGAYRPHRSGNRTGGASRPGYTRHNGRGNNSSYGSGNGSSRGRSGNVGHPTNASRPSNMSEGRGNYRSTPGMNRNNKNLEGALQQSNSNKEGVNRQSERRNNSSVSTRPNKSSSNDNSYSRPSNSNSNHNSSGSYSRPSSGGSNRGSGGFSGGSNRGGGRGRR